MTHYCGLPHLIFLLSCFNSTRELFHVVNIPESKIYEVQKKISIILKSVASKYDKCEIKDSVRVPLKDADCIKV